MVYGALETFTIEKNPQTFRTMTNGGKGGPDAWVELVDLTPIEFGEWHELPQTTTLALY